MERQQRNKWYPGHDDEAHGADETANYNDLVGRAIRGDRFARAGLEQVEADEEAKLSRAWEDYIKNLQKK